MQLLLQSEIESAIEYSQKRNLQTITLRIPHTIYLEKFEGNFINLQNEFKKICIKYKLDLSMTVKNGLTYNSVERKELPKDYPKDKGVPTYFRSSDFTAVEAVFKKDPYYTK